MSEVVIKIPRLHFSQEIIFDQRKRFNVLKCGRRFGKTTLIQELTSIALDGQYVGIWSPTYKDLHEVWKQLVQTLFPVIESKNEQVKQIVLITGGLIDMWSLDDPDSGRGRKYHRAIIDEAEKARHLKRAWEETIRGTLADYQGDAWFMSTPKFGQTYFKTTLFPNQDKYPDWMSWRFTSYDNPHLPEGEIEQIRKQLDDLTFRCEYLAEDVDVTLRPFAYAFSEEKHCGSCSFDPSYEVRLSFDFNVDPITCTASQDVVCEDGLKQLNYIKSFKLSNSDIYRLCDEILAWFGGINPVFLVTGDATGQARQAISISNMNYYRVIKQKLGLTDGQMMVGRINPGVGDSRVLVNSMLQNYRICIDRDNCQPLIYDLKYVQVDENGDIEKDRSDDTKKADTLDCFRYDLWTFFRWFVKIPTIE